MNVRVSHIPADLRKHDLDLLRGVSKRGEQFQADGLHALADVLGEVHGNALVVVAFRPRADRPVEDALLDVFEADLLKVLSVLGHICPGTPDFRPSFRYHLAPAHQDGVLGDGADVAQREDQILPLAPAPGRQGVKAGLDDLLVVGEAAEQRTRVDQVELGAVCPVVIRIVDLESAVRGDARGHQCHVVHRTNVKRRQTILAGSDSDQCREHRLLGIVGL